MKETYIYIYMTLFSKSVAGGRISHWQCLSHILHSVYWWKIISNKNWEEWN